ncbi:MAG: hypothetical protein PHO92_01285 [Candidatus Peribacteraceae bacterium]|nr:hypothetical protein [Candidatus Peribacteraceae bacterium]
MLLLLPGVAFAQDSLISDGAGGCDFASGQVHADCIPGYIAYLIKILFGFTGGICLIVILVGGFQYALGTVAGGKDKAMATIRYGIIGMILSALSYVIVNFIVTAIAG